MNYILIILFTLFVIGIIACATAMVLYLKFTKDYYSTPEDKTGLYDFITIKDNIINVDHIVNIKQVQSIKEGNYKIIIELDDNKEPIILDYDDDYNECIDVFTQINGLLGSGIIITD